MQGRTPSNNPLVTVSTGGSRRPMRQVALRGVPELWLTVVSSRRWTITRHEESTFHRYRTVRSRMLEPDGADNHDHRDDHHHRPADHHHDGDGDDHDPAAGHDHHHLVAG